MRVIATFILLGVLCHCGLCDGVEPTNATASTALAPTGVSGSAPTATAPAATATAAAVTTPAATATTGDNSEATPTSRATAPVGTTPASKTTTANETTPPNETTTTNETTPPNVTAPPNETTPTTGTTTTVAVTVSPEATTSKQPQELPTVMSASTASTPTATSPSTRTAATETTTAGSRRPPAVVPTSTANATHNPAGVPPFPQSQSPSSAATTVTVSQDAPGPGREVTTGNGTGILPKTTNAPVKGGGGEKTVVYVKGRTDDQGKPDFYGVCEDLMKAVQADECTLTTHPNGTIKSGFVQVNVIVLKELQEKHRHKEKDPPKNTTLIAILCSCAALLAMTAAFIAYTTCHRRSYRKNQQHLTEELQTVENGYHDNPTLEVMEVQPEMQEKKTALNGEFNDSWIVPFDPLAKDDMPDEEDTHL